MTSTAAAAPESETSRAPGPDDRARYVGLATRAVAFVIDALVIDVVAAVVAAVLALIASVFHFPKELETIMKWIGLGVYVLWLFGYFVAFWSATGQTPGNRVMQIRVVTATGERVKTRRGVVRCVGLVLAALPLFAGYVLILFDRKRRGFQDRLARTVVIEAPDLSLAQARLVRQREAYKAAHGRPTTAAG
jgi:uncharacterized RDD family membrane protein YckC